MFKSLLKITLRNFKKQLGFSMLNIFGLTIGLASFILIFLWINDEYSYEKAYKNASNIHIIYKTYEINGQTEYNPSTPLPLAPRLKSDIAEVEQAIRLARMNASIKYDNSEFNGQRFCASDEDYIKMFDLEFIHGTATEVFSEPHALIISENAASRYFKNDNPIGKILRVNDRYNLTVTGVYKNPPENSIVRYELIGRFDFLVETDNNRNDWGNHRYRTMISVNPKVDMKSLDAKMSDLIQEEIPEEKMGIKTLSLAKSRLYSIDGENQRIQYVLLFVAIAIFIITIACINFMNLSTARASRRSKEIGLRKVIGSGRGLLVTQFLIESILYVFISLFFAMMLVELFRPMFNELTNKQIVIDYTNLNFYFYLIGLVFSTGIISGSYPAFVMSSFKPILAIKNSLHVGVKGVLFRKVLVILQFAISIFLIISTFFIFFQIRSMQYKDLGFDKENVILFRAEGNIRSSYQAFRTELLRSTGIVNVTRSSQAPNDIENIFRNVEWEGMKQERGATFGAGTIDFDYFETLNMDIVMGRSFSKEYGLDSFNVIFNETAIKMMGYDDPIGKSFTIDDDHPGKIVGVVKDFYSRALTEDIEPVMFVIMPDWCNLIMVKLSEGHVENALEHVETVYKDFAAGKEFNFSFLEQQVARQYRSEQKIGALSAIFSFIAIVISCLGLFGLAAYTAEQKKKELGIRKVFGADSFSIIYKLSKSFAVWVLIANIIAWPISYIVMDNWLKNFAYRIDLHWWVFLLSGFIALVIALLTVGVQVAKASRKNPIESLKYE